MVSANENQGSWSHQGEVQARILKRMVSKGLIEKVTSEQRFKGGEDADTGQMF